MHSLALVPVDVALTPFPMRRYLAAAKLARASIPIIEFSDKPLPPPPAATNLSNGSTHLVVESSHVLLETIPADVRNDMVGCLQRAFDAMIVHVANKVSAHSFQRTMSGIQSSVMGLHRQLHPAPPEPRGRHNPFKTPGTGDRFRYGKNEFAATKLAELLNTCLGIEVQPESGYWADGDLLYRLQHSNIFGYFIVIERRAPDGPGLLTTIHQQITNQTQAQAALYKLELEYQWRSGLLGENPETGITLRVDLDDVSKVSKALEDEKARMDKRAAQVGAQAANASYRRRKAAAPPPPQSGPTLFALPAPKIQEA
jgi:hypothetical protein